MPAVHVNGEEITSSAIAAEAQNHPTPPGKPGLAWRAAARALIVRALLLQAARGAKISATPQKLDHERIETDEDALIRGYLDQYLEPRQITDADCARAYEAQPARYHAPGLYEASHILLAAQPDDGAARTRARDLAEPILQSVLENPTSFGARAQESSDCSSAANGGQLGQLRAGDTVPEFEAVLQSLNPGEIAPRPIETRFGLHIVRLDKRARGKALPFDIVRPQIRTALEKTAWASAAADLVARLIDAAVITGIDISPPPPESGARGRNLAGDYTAA